MFFVCASETIVMSYSIVSILALIVHVIINQDVLWNRPCKEVSADTALRRFFQAVMVLVLMNSPLVVIPLAMQSFVSGRQVFRIASNIF